MSSRPTASDDLTGVPDGDRRLGRRRRLLSSRCFQETFTQGRRYPGRYMILWTRQAPDAARRLGVVSNRRVGGAVERNRARRRLREVFRLNRGMLTGTADIVLVARAGCGAAPWRDLVEDFCRLARRAGIWKRVQSAVDSS